jgi:hypothetical protein
MLGKFYYASIPAIIFWDLTASNVITYQTIHQQSFIKPIHPPSNRHQYNMSLTNITSPDNYHGHMRPAVQQSPRYFQQNNVIAIISVALSKNHHNDIISAGQVIIHYDNIRPAI